MENQAWFSIEQTAPNLSISKKRTHNGWRLTGSLMIVNSLRWVLVASLKIEVEDWQQLPIPLLILELILKTLSSKEGLLCCSMFSILTPRLATVLAIAANLPLRFSTMQLIPTSNCSLSSDCQSTSIHCEFFSLICSSWEQFVLWRTKLGSP